MTTLYGISNCDTVKKAKKWLEAEKISFQFHDFRVDGLTEKTIKDWLQKVPLDKLINKRSKAWQSLTETEKNTLSKTTEPTICCEYETLIKRPVLVHQNHIIFGFKAAEYDSLFK